MSENPETILRFLGYGIDFIQTFAVAFLLAALTWRVAR
jgi:hypothetical protein